MKSLKLTIEGDPVHVEAIAARLREILDISHEGKNQRLSSKPDEVRRVLRIRPVENGD